MNEMQPLVIPEYKIMTRFFLFNHLAANARLGMTPQRARLLQQVLAHELNRGVELEVDVLLLLEAVAFVFSDEIPDGGGLLLQRGHDLIGLAFGDSRIIRSRDDEHRFRNLLRVI